MANWKLKLAKKLFWFAIEVFKFQNWRWLFYDCFQWEGSENWTNLYDREQFATLNEARPGDLIIDLFAQPWHPTMIFLFWQIHTFLLKNHFSRSFLREKSEKKKIWQIFQKNSTWIDVWNGFMILFMSNFIEKNDDLIVDVEKKPNIKSHRRDRKRMFMG